jgi:predicted RNA methylase
MTEPLIGFWTDPTGFLPNRLNVQSGRYEKFLTRSIWEALREDGVFVDIGVNVGFFSRQIARRFPRVKILAFEPDPRIYPLLKRNLNYYSNCTLLQVGLGATDGMLDFSTVKILAWALLCQDTQMSMLAIIYEGS